MRDKVTSGSLRRRSLLAALPALSLCHLQGNATADESGYGSAAFAALETYCGLYRLDNGGTIGIDRFITDTGTGVLFFSDYETSLVRPVFRQSGDRFIMGPATGGIAPARLTLRFTRDSTGRVDGLLVTCADGAQRGAARTAARDEEVAFTRGGATLAGTLTLPGHPGPHPAVILLHGSGPLTRHSFGPYRRFFNSLGLAVLTFDKRGTGASTGERLDASTGAPDKLYPAYYPDDLAADALAALAFMKTRPQIDPARIGLWGSSEGGMLSTHVAARSQEPAFAINSPGFMGPLWQTILYQGRARLQAAGASGAEIDAAHDFNRLWMDVARTGRGYEAYLRRRQMIKDAGRESWFYYYGGLYESLEQMQWSWNHILAFDSSLALKKVSCPVLGIFGEQDALTEAATAARTLHTALTDAGHPDFTTRIIPDATHSLMAVSREGMAPGVFDTLRSWLKARL